MSRIQVIIDALPFRVKVSCVLVVMAFLWHLVYHVAGNYAVNATNAELLHMIGGFGCLSFVAYPIYVGFRIIICDEFPTIKKEIK